MRIGIDARLYQETGVGRYICNLIKYLEQIDKDNNYVIFGPSGIKSLISQTGKFEIVTINIKWHSLKEQLFLPFIFSKHQLDLIHFPYFSTPLFYPGKFVITIHDLTNLEYRTGKASTLPGWRYQCKYFGYKLVLFSALLRAEKIIVPSKTVFDQVANKYPHIKSKIIVTYEGGLDKLNVKEKKLSLEPYILYVGNVYPHKNIENAVMAIDQLNNKRQDKVNFIIIGKDDFFQKRLKEFIKEVKIQTQIIFINDITDNTLLNLYKRAKCLIFPSLSEGFGLPALEAMQAKCLICCSEIPVFKEICADVPFYFNPKNINSITDVLNTVLNLTSLETKLIKERGVKQAQKFSWLKMVQETLAIYKKIKK